MKKTDDFWLSLIAGIFLIVGGTYSIVDGGGIFRGFPVPVWAAWGLFFCGLAFFSLGIRGILRHRKFPPPTVDIDAEAAKAEGELDQLYFKIHGKMPEKQKEE